jgi:prophage regulatory protein
MEKPGRSPRLVPWREVQRRVPYTRQHCGRLERHGLFPRRVRVGANRVAWIESELDAWIEARAAERGGVA